MSSEIEDHILKRFRILNKLGKGAYGIVWKAIEKSSNQTVALKKIFDAFRNSTDSQRTYREIMFLSQLKGEPGIIELKYVLPAYNNRDVYLVFEYMETDLNSVIRANILNDVHMRFIIFQILRTLYMVHSGELLHRDLKPSNILINSDCTIKLADFGLARSLKHINDKPPVLTEYVATRWYRAPEILIGSHSYSTAVDVWAVGCILAELLNGRPLFPGSSTMNQISKVLSFTGIPSDEDIRGLGPQLSTVVLSNLKHVRKTPFESFFRCNVPPDAKDLLLKLLEFNPRKRIKIEEALNHPFVASFNTGKYQLISLPASIDIPTNDNTKLTVDKYRSLVNEYINTQQSHVRQAQETPSRLSLFNKHKRPTPAPAHRPEPPKEKPQHIPAPKSVSSNNPFKYASPEDSTRLVAVDSSNSGTPPAKKNIEASPNSTQDLFAKFKIRNASPSSTDMIYGHKSPPAQQGAKNTPGIDSGGSSDSHYSNIVFFDGKYYVKGSPMNFE